jgi:hypothetical protein
MPVKLFILGLPGSGKSAIARSIVDYVDHQPINGWKDQRWSALRFNDYAILLDMFSQDTEGKRFQPAKPGGFDVIDLEAFDDALRIFEQEVYTYINSLESEEKKLVIVEFSRNDYRHAFQQFSSAFLQDSYFLHLEVDVAICKERVDKRRSDLSYPEDNFPVSDYIFENYYNHDDGKHLVQILDNYGVGSQRILVLSNNGEASSIRADIETFIDTIFSEDAHEHRRGISTNISNAS